MTKKHVSGWFYLTLALAIAVAAGAAQAQTITVLYTFNPNTDPLGFDSPGTMTQGQDGDIYSTALQGVGTQGAGAVFRMTPAGVLSVVYPFVLYSGGETPYSGVTLGTDGKLYGTVGPDLIVGGGYNGLGSVFSTTSAGNLTYLYTFPLGGNVGDPVYSTPVEGPDGNLYGGTASAIIAGVNVSGAIYKITPAGDLTVLYQTTDGGNFGTLTLGTDGNFYGIDSTGPILKITSAGHYTTLYNFNGDQPTGLIQGSDGNFYGDTFAGGSHGCGMVFKMTPKGKVTDLHDFDSANGDGCLNYAGLVQATDGNLYGVNQSGGTLGSGTIFRISPSGAGYANLYNFDGLTAGASQVTLLQHTNGILYGLSNLGGGVPCQTYCGSFYSLNVGLKPFARLVSASGMVGSTIGILGQGFTGTTKVSFSGVSAPFTMVSDTYLTATVPSGAKTGFVSVSKKGSALKSSTKFLVTPQVTGFNPPSGPVGTPVVITGSGLVQTSKVTFGGVKATAVTINSDRQVTATVPIGAKTGSIVVTTAGGTATSPGTFTVTP